MKRVSVREHKNQVLNHHYFVKSQEEAEEITRVVEKTEKCKNCQQG